MSIVNDKNNQSTLSLSTTEHDMGKEKKARTTTHQDG